MRISYRTATAISVVAIIVVVFVIFETREVPRRAISPIATQPNTEKKEEGESAGSSAPLRLSNRDSASSQATLERRLKLLKKRWRDLGVRELGPASPEDIAKRRELSVESARLLLCTKEAVDLIRFLESEGIPNHVGDEIGNLFRSDLSIEARKTLIALPDHFYNGINFRSNWSFEAGRFCPAEELKAFLDALDDPACRQQALFGRNLNLIATDPIMAVTSTLEELENGVESPRRSEALRTLMLSLPPDADFQRIARLLPTPAHPADPRSPYHSCLDPLFGSWAKANPKELSSHIMESSNKISPGYIEHPARELLRQDISTGIEWIQTLPDGPHFDAASRVAVEMLREQGYHEAASQLASQIGDPAFRRTMMARALRPLPHE